MRTQDSPFPPFWWGIDLEAAGVDARPRRGTYGKYRYEDLPPIPYRTHGDLAWLTEQPTHEDGIGEEFGLDPAPLFAACERADVSLPLAFTRFVGSLPLQNRVRSSTACFIDLSPGLVPCPAGGYLVRFLSDQQGCLFWYLHLVDNGKDHAVVCSPQFYGTETEETIDDGDGDDDGGEICFAAESFEAFLCRFWIENEVWFASVIGETTMSEVGQKYIDQYGLQS